MSNDALTPGVVFTAIILLTVAVFSVYVSRVYLPMKMKSAYLKSITALAAAVETKDSGTVGHAQRVAQLTMDLARRFGVAKRELERIEYAALLMDIGKANVPQSILNKREKLTEEEWEIVRSHTRLGAEMVQEVPFLADVAGSVLHHHEYWDGSGYPNGLTQEDIPLASRILCIAADYDAMISERPYHPRPLEVEEAAEEIRKGIGIRYDPRLAEVFLNMLDEEIIKSVANKAT